MVILVNLQLVSCVQIDMEQFLRNGCATIHRLTFHRNEIVSTILSCLFIYLLMFRTKISLIYSQMSIFFFFFIWLFLFFLKAYKSCARRIYLFSFLCLTCVITRRLINSSKGVAEKLPLPVGFEPTTSTITPALTSRVMGSPPQVLYILYT
jgi:hypothetical protein